MYLFEHAGQHDAILIGVSMPRLVDSGDAVIVHRKAAFNLLCY